MADSAVLVRAREALRLADAEPGRAVTLAAAAAADARRLGDGAAAAVADRAQGLAVRLNGDLDSAILHLERAVRTGIACGATDLAGEARMTLAYALVERGHTRRALREIDQALQELTGVSRARAL